jgi:DNA-binding MarR family transcriptional regulator
MREKAEKDGVEPANVSERQWDALGELRRLEDQGLTLARQVGGIHLATLKPLQACGLVVITESPDRDRKGRKWHARLTEAGRRATDGAPAAASSLE